MSIYDELHVRRVVNASGNNTRLGGCLLSQEVLVAMADASTCYVNMVELQIQAGKYISKITKSEDAHVTSGAAAALLLGTAACITRNDRPKMLKLPYTNKAEVVLQKGQMTGYHQAIPTTGATIVEVGLPYLVSAEEIEAAISERTVALCYTFGEVTSKVGMVPLEEMIAIGKKYNIPVIVDAAVSSYPPRKLHEFIELGADLVAFSSAKHIFGPPATGFICGRKELIEACRSQAGPYYGIGRPMKVGKEEIVGLLKALELYVNRDIENELRIWDLKVETLLELMNGLPQLNAFRSFPDEVDRPVPRVFIKIDENILGMSARTVVNRLKDSNPPIWTQEFLVDSGTIIVNPIGLLEGDEKIIYKSLREITSSPKKYRRVP